MRIGKNEQVLSCPKNCLQRYKNYMTKHKIKFREVVDDGKTCLVLPRKYRPHAWKRMDPAED